MTQNGHWCPLPERQFLPVRCPVVSLGGGNETTRVHQTCWLFSAAFRTAGRACASLSDGADSPCRSISAGRCVRRPWPPMGGQNEVFTRHGSCRKHWRGWLFTRCCRGRACPARWLYNSVGRYTHTHQRSPAQEQTSLRSGQGPGPNCKYSGKFLGIAVHPSVPAQTLKEFITYAKANPGPIVEPGQRSPMW
jgi:hypothetical protein